MYRWTPAPWLMEEDKGQFQLEILGKTRKGKRSVRICRVKIKNQDSSGTKGVPFDEGIANAYLITQAPVMANLLINITRFMNANADSVGAMHQIAKEANRILGPMKKEDKDALR